MSLRLKDGGENMDRKILRVNMEKKTINYEEVPEEYKTLGGRGLTSQIISDEVPADCHPLGPKNKIVIAPGIVTGTPAPSSGRLSVGGKSPLTGGIKESNAGTRFGQTIAKLGIKAIIIEGQTEDHHLLKIDKDGADLRDAEKWTDRGLYEVFEELREEFGKNIDIGAPGIAGEMGAANSGIAFNDLEGLPSRYSGRGGLGTVMASRGLKFVMANPKNAPGIEYEDEELFKEGAKKMREALGEHAVTKKDGSLNTYGTSVLVNIINEAGGLPHNNFLEGQKVQAEEVSGEKKREMIQERGGKTTHNCSPGCMIQCSEVWTKENGEDPVGPLEYETVWALGPNCGIYDLPTIGELNRACNDLGLDTIEMGNTIAVAMEGGLLEFGDEKGALELMEEIRDRTPLGRILANGTEFTGKAFGVTRVPTIKGQAMPAYDPRSVKGIGVTYATTTMGADHTAGYTIAPEILSVGGDADPLDSDGKVEMSKELQRSTAVIDSTGYCLFTAFAVLDIPEGLEGMVETVNGVLGTDLGVDDIGDIGKQILETERAFNKKAGISEEQDDMPEFLRNEEVSPHNLTFDISREQLSKAWED